MQDLVPKVAEDLARWCSIQRPKKGASGYVYLATSPLLNAAKIECWTGSLANLKSQYTTPYGPQLEIEKVFVSDCVTLFSKVLSAHDAGRKKERMRKWLYGIK